MRIHFLGGADTVTGSQHLIEAGGRLVLRDCGLYQGRRAESREVNQALPFDPRRLDAAVLSHAHIDHCGNLPTLAAQGYEKPIHATEATAALAAIMVRDAAKIQEQDAAYLNQKTNRRGLPQVEPLYTMADAERALRLLRGHSYGDEIELAPGIRHVSREAGHILGAALSVFTVGQNHHETRVGFAVDLGRHNLPLIRDPDVIENIDALVLESTYGDRLHDDALQAEDQLRGVVARAIGRGGRVLIPAFALERAQELIYHLSKLVEAGRLPRVPVFVDSPMASAITRVFDQKMEYLDEEFHRHHEKAGCLMCPSWVRFVSSVEESKAVTASGEPCIIIAGSGMCEHGRILHHLKHGIENPKNAMAIVGYQAVNTLGRRLVDGEKRVRIFGDEFPVRAEVAVLQAFSAHADRNELLAYVRKVRPKATYLVHGEQKQREALAEALRSENLTTVHLPRRGDIAEL
jgi:metallo-beta-lactamase family protein